MVTDPVIRRFSDSDSISDLTALLHRAYAELAERGLRYLATRQDDDTTRNRISHGECWVAEENGRIVATIVLSPPDEQSESPGRAWFSQFGVDPDRKGQGVGSLLLRHIEERAKELGAAEIALDTALPATHLIRFYEKRGYVEVGRVDWDITNYESVIMAKPLG